MKDFCYGFARPHCDEEYVACLKESDSDFSSGWLIEVKRNGGEISISMELENGVQQEEVTVYGYDRVK